LEKLKGRDRSEDLGVDGRIILEQIFGEVGWEYAGWMQMAEYRGQWWALVNAVMNLRNLGFHKGGGVLE
jgi:hypothetical protein